MSLKEYAEFMAKGDKPSNKFYQYLLQHGESFVGAVGHTALPRSMLVRTLIKPRAKWCFYNAQMLSMLHLFHKIDYYEGIANNGVFEGLHAWNVYNGKVVDITWEDIAEEFKDVHTVLPLEQFQYLGIKIPHDFVKKNNPIGRANIEPLFFKYQNLL